MNNISILIVDDDLLKITILIDSIRESFKESLTISQASCVQEAIENLQKKEFHLLITDLNMPLRAGERPDSSGGKALIKSIYRKKYQVNVPMYIIALTQYADLKDNFEGAWKVWHFDSSSAEWKKDLRDLIFHISLVKSRILLEKTETLFVEGPTDKLILEAAQKAFFPELDGKVFIDTISFGGGSSWVERQLFIWAKSLNRKDDDSGYIKAVGLFDNDPAGRDSIEKLRGSIVANSAESKTFSIIRCSYKYSPLLKNIRNKGATISTAIEELISPGLWEEAQKKGWLIDRSLNSINFDKEIQTNRGVDKLTEFCATELSVQEGLILTNKLSDSFKKKFCNLACEAPESSLVNVRFLLQDIYKKLKILP